MNAIRDRLVKRKPMEPVAVRIPPELREKARQVARDEEEAQGVKYTETDVYRTAIELFLGRDFTESTVKQKGGCEEDKAS